jgi:hypothetical protein
LFWRYQFLKSIIDALIDLPLRCRRRSWDFLTALYQKQDGSEGILSSTGSVAFCRTFWAMGFHSWCQRSTRPEDLDLELEEAARSLGATM